MWTSKSTFAEDAGGQSTHTEVFSEATTFYFICSVGGHCAAGQKVKVIVQSAAAESESSAAESESSDGGDEIEAEPVGDVAQATLTVHFGGQVNVGAGGMLVLGGKQD